MTDFFSPDYFTARDRFRSAVLEKGGQIESILLVEDLTIDIGWFGVLAPKRVLVHSSGLHGVEGFAGSAIQLHWLDRGLPALPADGAIAIAHCLNPFGMAWLRRTNENRVDLNRNFLAADEEYSGAPQYAGGIAALLRGFRGLRRMIVQGQYEYPDGLFYGGKHREQGARRYQIYLSDRLANAERIAAIDVHTGTKHPTPGKGSLASLFERMFPAAKVVFEEQKFHVCGDLKAFMTLRNESKADMKEVYCPRDPKWREEVLLSGEEAIEQAVNHLLSCDV